MPRECGASNPRLHGWNTGGAAYRIVRRSLSTGRRFAPPRWRTMTATCYCGSQMTAKAQKLIVLAGLPGSGKSTLAEGLSRSLSVPVFSVDPIEAAMWRGGLARAQTGVAAYDVAVTTGGRASAARALRHRRRGRSGRGAPRGLAKPRRPTPGRPEDHRMPLRGRGGSPRADRGAGSRHRRHAGDHMGPGSGTARGIPGLDRCAADAGYARDIAGRGAEVRALKFFHPALEGEGKIKTTSRPASASSPRPRPPLAPL